MNSYLKALKKYTDFNGRATRGEYWSFVIINGVISFLLLVADMIIGTYNPESGYGLLSTVFNLAVIIPTLTVTVRRLHDTNRGGATVLIALIPIIGGLILFLYLIQDSQPGENQYGPHPQVLAKPAMG